MIRNVIFDLGNVLISFRPAEFLSEKKYEQEERELILSDIFGSREWLLLDNGDITAAEAIERISSVSLLKPEIIARIFNTRMEIFSILTHNADLLPELKKMGFKLYFLSNFPGDLFPDVKSKYSFFSLFEGGIISAEARCSKPDHHIYRLLLDTYALKPAECLYIDDLEANVKTAITFGMKGIITHGNENIREMVLEALVESQSILSD